jgi:hypothetical protein
MMPDGAFSDNFGAVVSDEATGQENYHAIMGDNLEN